jgi:superfamily II DNA or RNA helicase
VNYNWNQTKIPLLSFEKKSSNKIWDDVFITPLSNQVEPSVLKTEKETFVLRPYQKEAVDKTFECIKSNPQHGYCISAPCASGKSLIIAEMARRVVNGEVLIESSGRVLVVSHVQEIVQQDYEHLDLLLPGRVGVFSAGLKRRDVDDAVIVAGVQSVWRSTRLGRFDMLVVDECFVAGTMITTSTNDQAPIENVTVGTWVHTYNGLGVVEAVSVRNTTKFIHITLSNGRTIRCTPNHLFFARTKLTPEENYFSPYRHDWIAARDLKEDDLLYRLDIGKIDTMPVCGVTIKSITKIQEQSPVPVYNLQVKGHPSYYADGVLVHNCHLIPPHETSMYRTLIEKLRETNPNLVLVGLTATPFRTDGGNIYGEGKLFDRLSYDIDYKTLMEQGFIVGCRAKEIEIMTEDDFRNLRTRMGEYEQSSVDRLYSTLKINDIVRDVIRRTEQCKQILVFAPNVAACYVIQKQLSAFGGAEVITGETPKDTRMQLIDDFKNFKYKYLINVNCLTTGFNVTTIDCVAFIRPTKSPVLYAQTVSRGIRKAEGKDFVHLLDYGGNVQRHGTIDDLYVPDYKEPKPKNKGLSGILQRISEISTDTIDRDVQKGITKTCPQCKEMVRTHVAICPDCGFDFVAEERRKEEEERRALEEAERLRAIEVERLTKEWERKRKENPKVWESAKREARLEVLRDLNTIFCGRITGVFVKKYESQYSGKRSLQLIFGIMQEVTYQFGGETFEEDVFVSALLWLHFNDVGNECLARGHEWWEKLTGQKNIIPQNIDEAFEMRKLIVKPVTASYQVIAGRGKFYSNVIDVDYGEQGHPGVDEKLYQEFNRNSSDRKSVV